MFDQVNAEDIQVAPIDPLGGYVASVAGQEIGSLLIDPQDVPIQVFCYMANDGFYAESMVEAMRGLAELHNQAVTA